MNFLCPNHRQQLCLLTAHESQQLALNWLNKAVLFYEIGQYQEACAHIGCTFELNCLRLQQESSYKEQIIQQITLSSIFLHNCLLQVHETEKAALSLAISQQIILRHWSKNYHSQKHSQCLEVLLDKTSHKPFFQRHLTLELKDSDNSHYQQQNNQQEYKELYLH